MQISIIGTGYVGLVAGVCFAESGNNVICVDNNKSKLAKLEKGNSPIYEPGLNELLKKNILQKRISFTSNTQSAIQKSDVIFLALPTPQLENGEADLKHVIEVAIQIGKFCNGYKLVVTKSTVPVGTTKEIQKVISKNTNWDFDVCSNPEFLKEGSAISDFQKPDRIIVGAEKEKAFSIMRDLYNPFVRSGNPIIEMDISSSELSKYTANAFLASKISFMNEIANLCEKVGADIEMVRRAIGSDPRIGNQFLFAGLGYGGSCFPKDIKAIIKTAHKNNLKFNLLENVEEINLNQRTILTKKIIDHFKGKLKNKKFAIWGLSFKPNTDDMREAPSISIITELIKNGANVSAYDPVAMESAKLLLPNKVEFGKNPIDILKDSDALIIVTEWGEFRNPDFNKIKKLLKEPIIFDGRNIYDPKKMDELKFTYYGIGRRKNFAD